MPMSIVQAAAKGIERVRQEVWADPFDHIKLDLDGSGRAGPWLHLYSPFNKECNGRDPVDFISVIGVMRVHLHAECFVPYTGPLPESEEYQRRVLYFDGCMKEK